MRCLWTLLQHGQQCDCSDVLLMHHEWLSVHKSMEQLVPLEFFQKPRQLCSLCPDSWYFLWHQASHSFVSSVSRWLQDVVAWWGLIGCGKEWRMPHQQACPDAPMRVISTCWTHPDSCLADSTWRSLHVLVLASPPLSNTKSTREEKEGEHSLEDGSFYSF